MTPVLLIASGALFIALGVVDIVRRRLLWAASENPRLRTLANAVRIRRLNILGGFCGGAGCGLLAISLITFLWNL